MLKKKREKIKYFRTYKCCEYVLIPARTDIVEVHVVRAYGFNDVICPCSTRCLGLIGPILMVLSNVILLHFVSCYMLYCICTVLCFIIIMRTQYIKMWDSIVHMECNIFRSVNLYTIFYMILPSVTCRTIWYDIYLKNKKIKKLINK